MLRRSEHLQTQPFGRKSGNGAWGRIRTTDTRIFNPLLYQLSYPGQEPPARGAASIEEPILEVQRGRRALRGGVSQGRRDPVSITLFVRIRRTLVLLRGQGV